MHVAELRISEEVYQEAHRLMRTMQLTSTLVPNIDVLQRIALLALLSIEKGMMLEVPSTREIDEIKKEGNG